MNPQYALIDRPASGSLTLAAIVVLVGFAWSWWMWWSTRPEHLHPGPPSRPRPDPEHGIEPPAIVGLITGDFEAAAGTVTGTVLDLAQRGWLRLTAVDGELVVVSSGTPTTGDVLAPYEQQVFNHLASRAFNDYTSAGTLAVAQADLGSSWRARFRRSVAAAAQQRGLTADRYPLITLVAAAAAGGVAIVLLLKSLIDGQEVAVADSMLARTAWFVVLFFAGWLLLTTWRRYSSASQIPTEYGIERASAWLGYRQRLADRIPANASVIGTSKQQRALGDAVVMGVADYVYRQIPIVRPDIRRGWSEAGGVAHVVAVHYPIRPGYGQHPVRVAIFGVVGIIVVTWLRGFFGGVADGSRLGSFLDDLPGGSGIVRDLAKIVQIALWLPLIPLAWCAIAGLIDMTVSRERLGAVVRSRPPEEVLPAWLSRIVKPFGSRGSYLTYLAIDDGTQDVVAAAIANERTAAPQGAQTRISVTPLLGYIHHTVPVGTAGNLAHDGHLGRELPAP